MRRPGNGLNFADFSSFNGLELKEKLWKENYLPKIILNERHFCFIPAKSNSNRLKNKNCHLLNGKPLFYYPISAAIKSGIFDKNGIIVSSDSNEIIVKVKNMGLLHLI